MSDTLIVFIGTVLMVLMVSISDFNTQKEKTSCVTNISKQNLTADEISKLCGVGK